MKTTKFRPLFIVATGMLIGLAGCHRKPEPFENPNVVKRSQSGICHDASSRWYHQTIHYTAFRTLQECLDSGGRLPKS